MCKQIALIVLPGLAVLLGGCADPDLIHELDNSQAELATLKTRHARSTHELAGLKRRYEGQRKSQEALGLTILQRDQEIGHLASRIRNLEVAHNRLISGNADLKTNLSASRAEAEQLKRMVADYVVQLKQQKQDMLRLISALKTVPPPAIPPLPATRP